jgi:hypothetical protein
LLTEAQAGTGLIITPFTLKYVQKIHHHEGHFIAIDLFLPSNKLNIKLQKFISFIITHINKAEKQLQNHNDAMLISQ